MLDDIRRLRVSRTTLQLLIVLNEQADWVRVRDILENMERDVSISSIYSNLTKLSVSNLVEVKQSPESAQAILYRISANGKEYLDELLLNRDIAAIQEFQSTQGEDASNEDTLVTNQAFLQTIDNLQKSVRQSKKMVNENNYLAEEHTKAHTELLSYLEETDERLSTIIKQIDLSENPEPVQSNMDIAQWIEKEWPESIEKLDEFTSKKALAEMLVPTGIVAAFGLAAVVVGAVFGTPPVVSFGAGSFLGMFATRQISVKDVGKNIKDTIGTNDEPDSGSNDGS